MTANGRFGLRWRSRRRCCEIRLNVRSLVGRRLTPDPLQATGPKYREWSFLLAKPTLMKTARAAGNFGHAA